MNVTCPVCGGAGRRWLPRLSTDEQPRQEHCNACGGTGTQGDGAHLRAMLACLTDERARIEAAKPTTLFLDKDQSVAALAVLNEQLRREVDALKAELRALREATP